MAEAPGWRAYGQRQSTLLPLIGGASGEGGGGAAYEGKGVYGLLAERPAWRPVTHYEKRGIEELGHDIYDLCFVRLDGGEGPGLAAVAAAGGSPGEQPTPK
jgi:hypothetical protein